MLRRLLQLTLVLACFFSLGSAAHALIMALTPLQQLLEKQQFIFVAKVSEVLPDRPAMILTRADNLKGEFPFERLPINLTGDSEAAKDKHTQVMLDRVAKDTSIVLFVTKREKKSVAMGFMDGTWFSMDGRIEEQDGKQVIRWTFSHCEPYMRRTFNGTTADMIKTVQEGLSGKKVPPAPNEKEEPGFGKPIKKTSSAPGFGGLLFGVIQLPFLGAIAALAAIFPAVFGGAAIMMRRWVLGLSIASTISLLFAIQMFFPRWLSWGWMKSPSGLWWTAAGIAVLAALWSGQRYRRAERQGKLEEFQPRKLDRVLLAIFVSLSVIGLGVGLWMKESMRDSPWLETIVMAIPLTACLYYVCVHHWRTRGSENPKPVAISAETVGLWTGACAAAVTATFLMGGVVTGDALKEGEKNTTARWTPKFRDKPLWVYEPKEGGEILASPCYTPESVFIAVHHREGFLQFGRLYAIDPNTGKEQWKFDDDEEMKPVFCSPIYANGLVYIGEGFHQNNDCKMFAVDAKTGKKVWEFKTTSHTESTPVVAEGKIVFGAGNDGIYCLDAKTGAKLWQHKGEKGLHIDANPVIHQGKVYAGSGYSKTHQITRIFCLNLQDGQEVWGERIEYSAFGSPLAVGNRVYFATGNGTFSEDRTPIAGLILCRDASTGKALWERALPNSAVCRPAADRHQLYVGCRDGKCYALNRYTGEVIWNRALGGPVLASPVLGRSPQGDAGEVVYALGGTGTLAALSPQEGEPFWSTDLRAITKLAHAQLWSTPAVVLGEIDGKETRRIFLGSGLGASATASPVARLYCFADDTE